MKELAAGVGEAPPGSNSGPRVREYLAPCVRGDKNTKLHLTASNWCMAFSSWCTYQALNVHDKAPPHGYRAGVVEAVADVRDAGARWTGQWVPVALARGGQWAPHPGDLAIYDRSDPRRPETSWWRHVNRVVTFDAAEGTFRTVGGNEGGKVALAEQAITKSTLLGFIAYPQEHHVQSKEMLSEHEREQISNLVALTIDGMLRGSVWGQGDGG